MAHFYKCDICDCVILSARTYRLTQHPYSSVDYDAETMIKVEVCCDCHAKLKDKIRKAAFAVIKELKAKDKSVFGKWVEKVFHAKQLEPPPLLEKQTN